MINPIWQQALSARATRRRITLSLQGESISLELIGETTVGIVRTHHNGRDLRPSDVIWVKEMGSDGITIRDFQFFPEGLPGVTRGTERVALVEAAKSKALTRGATELTTNLGDLLKAANDKELGSLFQPHLALIELFINGRPETADRLKHENPRMVRAMLMRCLTLQDVTGRRNPHSKVLGVKSATKRLRAMSARRMATANTALTTSLTLSALMRAMHELVIEVDTEIASKLNANTWNMDNPTHLRWLKRFAKRLTTWADELGDMDMHPFAQSAAEAECHLKCAAVLMQGSFPATNISHIKNELRHVLMAVRTLIARFQVAEMLRVVGTARDERVRKLGLEVKEPVWTDINFGLEKARETFGIKAPLALMTPNASMDERILLYYEALRDTANFYDTKSRIAA